MLFNAVTKATLTKKWTFFYQVGNLLAIYQKTVSLAQLINKK
jgi:hypothetical protein